jgi:hypothetical protein
MPTQAADANEDTRPVPTYTQCQSCADPRNPLAMISPSGRLVHGPSEGKRDQAEPSHFASAAAKHPA